MSFDQPHRGDDGAAVKTVSTTSVTATSCMKRFGFWRRENKRIRAAEFLERGGRISNRVDMFKHPDFYT
jgi:hypothetical protein